MPVGIAPKAWPRLERAPLLTHSRQKFQVSPKGLLAKGFTTSKSQPAEPIAQNCGQLFPTG